MLQKNELKQWIIAFLIVMLMFIIGIPIVYFITIEEMLSVSVFIFMIGFLTICVYEILEES